MTKWWGRLVALALCIGAYWGASGLLQFHEVFFSPTVESATSKHDTATVETVEFPPTRQYDRLVVVLIDAMRADMVLGSNAMYTRVGEETDPSHDLSQHMRFTRSLLTSGTAAGYIAHASVPTVTMPRLKALLSGKPPAFIDILKNFNSAALADENVIQLMRDHAFRIVFYGDDTWLKLFPDAFQRSEGTSGFYTRDTVEVDTNVTRHLREELDPMLQHPKSRDWDVLVLHYLGLDHVGHLRGPRSSMMVDKLHEMDEVIKLIYDSVRQQDTMRQKEANVQPTLIVLCSDHGMSEIGNHGGATVEESSALMAFMRGDGKPFQAVEDVKITERRLQVDLVPTIATLFGLRIPTYNTGRLLDRIVRAPISNSSSSRSDLLEALHSNLLQLHKLAQLKFPETGSMSPVVRDLVRQVHQRLRSGSLSTENDEVLIQALTSACQELQEKIARSDGSEYDTILIGAGVGLLLVCGVVAAHFASHSFRPRWLEASSSVSYVAIGDFVATIVSLSSTSSIENEHATVFLVTTTFLFAMVLDALKTVKSTLRSTQLIQLFASLTCIRLLRERSQVINFARLNNIPIDSSLPGNEFATDDSLSVWFTGPLFESANLPLAIQFAIIYASVVGGSVLRWKTESRSSVWKGVVIAVFTGGMITNVWCSQLITSDGLRTDIDFAARCVYGSAALLLAIGAGFQAKFAFEMALWILATMVQKSSNLPSVAVLCVLLQLLSAVFQARGHGVSKPFVGLFAVWMASAAFFALGNSHLVTTIDISQSYHGLQGYSQVLVGTLTFINAFSGPLVVLTRSIAWLRLHEDKSSDNSATTAAMWMMLSYQAFRMAFYTIIVYFMRFHLFIWSVFAPKMLYEVVFTVVVAMFTTTISY